MVTGEARIQSLSSGVDHLTATVLARGGVDAVRATEGARFSIPDETRSVELVSASAEATATFRLFAFRIGHGSTLG
jgi:hypothetical protein